MSAGGWREVVATIDRMVAAFDASPEGGGAEYGPTRSYREIAVGWARSRVHILASVAQIDAAVRDPLAEGAAELLLRADEILDLAAMDTIAGLTRVACALQYAASRRQLRLLRGGR